MAWIDITRGKMGRKRKREAKTRFPRPQAAGPQANKEGKYRNCLTSDATLQVNGAIHGQNIIGGPSRTSRNNTGGRPRRVRIRIGLENDTAQALVLNFRQGGGGWRGW